MVEAIKRVKSNFSELSTKKIEQKGFLSKKEN